MLPREDWGTIPTVSSERKLHNGGGEYISKKIEQVQFTTISEGFYFLHLGFAKFAIPMAPALFFRRPWSCKWRVPLVLRRSDLTWYWQKLTPMVTKMEDPILKNPPFEFGGRVPQQLHHFAQEGLGLRNVDGGRSWHWCPMAQMTCLDKTLWVTGKTPRVITVHCEVLHVLDYFGWCFG